MAFYKLFYIVHRRTDYYKLHRMIDEMMYTEYYEELRRRSHNAVAKLLTAHSIIMGELGRHCGQHGHYW